MLLSRGTRYAACIENGIFFKLSLSQVMYIRRINIQAKTQKTLVNLWLIGMPQHVAVAPSGNVRPKFIDLEMTNAQIKCNA